ncbi:MFS general substrate transporter [Tothia fuscella]|uniref:MFS general substrate transporter n=1 Tax=Tothia fuscella TaxID=1048955 RepID=A0A9P4U526_9PEZI|nr:MFS general substrate transporter [Tothia fuscella]
MAKAEPVHSLTSCTTYLDDKTQTRDSFDVEKRGGVDKSQHEQAHTGKTDDEPKEKIQGVRDPHIVDYDGDDDPMNPLNWTAKKKWIMGGFLSGMTFVTPLASSMFAPGVAQVMREFNSSSSILASMVVSIYILGYACGPLFIAPMSEIYGRLPVYHVTNVLFVVFTIACGVSTSLGMLIAFRLLAGMMGSTPLTIGGGTMSDMFRVEERGAAMSIWALGPLLGPVIGPVAGGYLIQAKGWRWVFYVLTMVSGVVTIAMFIFHRETYAGAILEKKAKKLRKETGYKEYVSKLDSGLAPRALFAHSIIRPIKMLLFSPLVFFLSLYMAIVYGYLYLLFTTISSVFEGIYHFSQGSVGLAFLGLGIGMFFGLFVAGVTSDRGVKYLTAKNNGVYKPEYRLPLMVPAACLIPIGLFIYGWTARASVHWFVPIFGTSFVGMGMITTFMPITTYLIDSYTIHAASVVAANTVLRSLGGAFLPLAGPRMYATLGLNWGNSLLGFIALALVPLPFFFWKYGERIRTSKRFAVNW